MRISHNLLLVLAIASSLQLGLGSGDLLCFENDGSVRIEAQDGLGNCGDKATPAREGESLEAPRGHCPPCRDISLQALSGTAFQKAAPRATAPPATLALPRDLQPGDAQGTTSILRHHSAQSTRHARSSYRPRTIILQI